MASYPDRCGFDDQAGIHVAAGILRDPQGRVLVSRRPEGKPQAGAWEFPGGKLAAGELPLAGLVRELREELGIDVILARNLTRFVHNYPRQRVFLYIWLVLRWNGTPDGLEGQPLRWLRPGDLMQQGLLAADETVAALLQTDLAVNTVIPEPTLR